jgi:hypothetical protein
LSRAYVVITEGAHKGMKAKVLYADDNIANLEILANCKKIEVKRSSIKELRDPT